jgi:rRNA processing protein Gar1
MAHATVQCTVVRARGIQPLDLGDDRVCRGAEARIGTVESVLGSPPVARSLGAVRAHESDRTHGRSSDRMHRGRHRNAGCSRNGERPPRLARVRVRVALPADVDSGRPDGSTRSSGRRVIGRNVDGPCPGTSLEWRRDRVGCGGRRSAIRELLGPSRRSALRCRDHSAGHDATRVLDENALESVAREASDRGRPISAVLWQRGAHMQSPNARALTNGWWIWRSTKLSTAMSTQP